MRILLVDDDRTLRRSLVRLLARAPDISIDEADGVAEAGALLGAHEYDVVVSDEQMADGFGHVLLASTAAVQPWCRRALMSGASAPAGAEPSWEKFFSKPDGLPELEAWIRALPRGTGPGRL